MALVLVLVCLLSATVHSLVHPQKEKGNTHRWQCRVDNSNSITWSKQELTNKVSFKSWHVYLVYAVYPAGIHSPHICLRLPILRTRSSLNYYEMVSKLWFGFQVVVFAAMHLLVHSFSIFFFLFFPVDTLVAYAPGINLHISTFALYSCNFYFHVWQVIGYIWSEDSLLCSYDS